MTASPVAQSIARAAPAAAPTVVPITAPTRRLRLFDAVVEAGCELISLGGRGMLAYVRSRAHDGRHDARLIRGRQVAGSWAQVAAVNGCGCDRGFAAVAIEIAGAEAEDAGEDGWLGVMAVAIWRMVGICRGLNRSLERELTRRRRSAGATP